MARRKYSTRPRRVQNVTWQPVMLKETVTVPSGTVGQQHNGTFGEIRPGVGRDVQLKPFLDDHVLERIRGMVAHNGSQQVRSSGDAWFPFSLALVRVPNGFEPPDDMDLFDADKGDDFPLRIDAVCNANQTVYPNYHEVDGKAKRKLETGDVFAWLWSLISPVSGTFNLGVTFNGRFLWRLKI